jgi:hypothetical protein
MRYVLINSQPGAMADVVVKLGIITILKKTFDICDEAFV